MLRYGSQKPTFSTVGEYHHTFGPNIVRMFNGWGVRFYPCQEDELSVFLARDSRNRFACRTICISKPRQNGKSFGVRFYAIVCAAVEGRHVLFTAHRGKTVRKMFKFIRTFVLSVPDLAEKLLPGADGIYKAAGAEGIYFANGGMIEFATRTEGGARGETYDVIIFDEAQELTDDQYDAVVPTTIASESGDPQKIYLGTPPGPKCQGTVFRGLHDKAHSGTSDGVWWIEWAVTEIPDMSDPMEVLELVYLTNPAMGYRIKEDVMLDVIKTATSADGFAREFLGWWVSTVTKVNAVITEKEWNACRIKNPKREGLLVLAVKFSADGSTVALCGAVIPDDGPARISLIELRPTGHGIGWLADWLNERYNRACCVVIDGRNGVDVLVERIADTWRMKGSVIRPSTRDMIAATGTLTNALNERSVSWFYQQEALNDSAITSVKRPVGGGWCFGGDNSIPIEAASLALWGAQNSKRNPNKQMRIG